MGKVAEIWMGNRLAYRITEIKDVKLNMDGSLMMITGEEGWTFETSPHNVVIIDFPKGGE